jgi:hypothetical protein
MEEYITGKIDAFETSSQISYFIAIYTGEDTRISLSLVIYNLADSLITEYSSEIYTSTHCAAVKAISSTQVMYLTLTDVQTYTLYLVEFEAA